MVVGEDFVDVFIVIAQIQDLIGISFALAFIRR